MIIDHYVNVGIQRSTSKNQMTLVQQATYLWEQLS